ncbi:MAG: peptidoglycan-binding protein [Bacteroidota bacterium]
MKLIKKGSTGILVNYLHKKLNDLGYSITEADFGAQTEAAVNDFQQKNKLKVDAVVGGQTWLSIYLRTETPRKPVSKIDRYNNIMHLHPTVRMAVVKVYTQLQSEGIPFKIFEAFRHPERQADLYAQGRTKPGNIVTYAQPWSSYHQYGLAVDFVLLINGNWSWDTKKEKGKWWMRMNALGAQEGLMRLDFEVPHLQIIGTSSSALRQGIYPVGGDKSWIDNLTTAIKEAQ